MNRLLVLLCLVVMYCAGCATLETVTQPTFSFTPDDDFPLMSSSATQNVKFVAKDGNGKTTQDNVTVEVSDIVGQSGPADYSMTIEDREQKYNFSVFPMLLVLKITNNTDHIVTLNNTIIKIEDDKQNDYPMIDAICQVKQKAITNIRDMYSARRQKFKETNLADLKDRINTKFKPQYDQFVIDVRAKMANGVSIRFPETKPGMMITAGGLNQALKYHSPIEEYNRHVANLNSIESIMSKRDLEKIASISKQIEEKIPNNLKGVITSGIYQPINILPGRSEKVLVPFSKRRGDEIINKVNIGIYDLPTMVNEAGVPTKRAKFNFEMVAVESK